MNNKKESYLINLKFSQQATRYSQRGNKRGDLNISFGWLFAIIVGAVILSLVIFGVTKFVKTSQQEQDVVSSKELGILLNPLETGFESASSTPLSMPSESRIIFNCEEFGEFGEQKISISQKSFNKWTNSGSEVSFENKYIFSEKIAEGKKFYVFSKPFEFPFKVSDVIYLTSSEKNYCFEDAPEEIEEEITGLKQKNLAPNCTGKEGYIKVCFEERKNCDIEVDMNFNLVKKENSEVYFEGNVLMYAAIFSDEKIYECQLQRLLKRTKKLAEIYNEKSLLMTQKGCSSYMEENLIQLAKESENVKISSDLPQIKFLIDDLAQQNENSYYCKLW